MGKINRLIHRFVERVPSPLEDGVLYVSIEFGTAIHKCCCGCGDKVVTPLTPIDWVLVYDGQSVSLQPSIGRWNAPCRSHYWIRNNRVIWSPDWSRDKVDILKQHEAALRDEFFELVKDYPRREDGDKPDKPKLARTPKRISRKN